MNTHFELFLLLICLVTIKNHNLETATLGIGCLWYLEAVFQRLKGIEDVEPVYSGGQVKGPTYRDVCGKRIGHTEVA